MPRVGQPLFTPVPLAAYRQRFFVPANEELKMIAKLSVSVVPLGTAVELPPRAIAHWLFWFL